MAGKKGAPMGNKNAVGEHSGFRNAARTGAGIGLLGGTAVGTALGGPMTGGVTGIMAGAAGFVGGAAAHGIGNLVRSANKSRAEWKASPATRKTFARRVGFGIYKSGEKGLPPGMQAAMNKSKRK